MKALGIFLTFILIFILGFYAVGFADSIEEPTAGTDAANQYNNLTQAVTISSDGLYATLLILTAAMVIAALMFLAASVKRR